MKKDYLGKGAMADSADLVVLGAWYGTGNKGELFGKELNLNWSCLNLDCSIQAVSCRCFLWVCETPPTIDG